MDYQYHRVCGGGHFYYNGYPAGEQWRTGYLVGNFPGRFPAGRLIFRRQRRFLCSLREFFLRLLQFIRQQRTEPPAPSHPRKRKLRPPGSDAGCLAYRRHGLSHQREGNRRPDQETDRQRFCFSEGVGIQYSANPAALQRQGPVSFHSL